MPLVLWLAGWIVRVILPYGVVFGTGLLLAFSDLWMDTAINIFDALLGLAVKVFYEACNACTLGAFNPNDVTSFANSFGSLPVEIVGMATLLDLPRALGIVVCALVIRFVLQMIPFVRWGSK